MSSNRVEEKASSEESAPQIILGACHVLLLAWRKRRCIRRTSDVLSSRRFEPVADYLRRTRDRRRQRQELIDYLASDHRAARDLGITIYEVDNLCR